MLQDIRQNIQGPAAKVVVGLIVIAFSFFGIESILLGGGSNSVAEVNGQEITPMDLQQAVTSQQRRLMSMMGENFDPAMLDDQRLRAAALETLIGRKLLLQSAEDKNLTISERQIGALIAGMEQFQINGEFSPDMYKSAISSAGFTPAMFKQTLREDLLVGQMRSGLAGTEFATPAELVLNARIIGEQRDLRYLTIPLEKFLAEINLAEGDVDSWYKDNQDSFRTEESVDLDYIELSLDDFREPVQEQSLREAYELEAQSAAYQTESRVSHILFEAGADASDEALQARIAAAQEQLVGGADFADVAREFSDDIGSANGGGDLGFTSGDAFPQEMEEAIAALDVDGLSGPVVTEAGTHLILVTDRRDGKPPSFEEMRAQLEDRLQVEAARVDLLLTVENLKDMVFNAEDLSGPADELALEVALAEKVNRSQAQGHFANPSVLSAAFSEEVLEAGHNSEVIELGGDEFIVMRVRRHHESEVQPLELVREDIVAILTERAARAAVEAEALTAVERLRNGQDMELFAAERGYTAQVELAVDRANTAVPPPVLRRAFELPVPLDGSHVVDFVANNTGDALVVELQRIDAGDFQSLEELEQQRLRQQVTVEYGSAIDTEFQQGLRSNADISVL